jgi:hypothetical protein
MIAYKFLKAGAVAPFTGFRWRCPARQAGPLGRSDSSLGAWASACGAISTALASFALPVDGSDIRVRQR